MRRRTAHAVAARARRISITPRLSPTSRSQDIHAPPRAELSSRGVTFRSAPHPIADLGDRVLWLSDFEDGEGNVFALMAEIPKAASS